MPTIPRYPPDGGIPRCPICDAPYQTCTHDDESVPAPPPRFIVDVALPRRVRRTPDGAVQVETRAVLGPPIRRSQR